MLSPRDRLIFALDVPRRVDALALFSQLRDHVGCFKIGLELFVAEGPQLAREISHRAPVFLDLKGKPVLLVGGGSVAFRKAGTLLASGCRLKVVASHVTPLFREWLEENAVEWVERPYHDGEAEGYFLVVSATDDPRANRRIYDDASRAGRL